MRIKARDIADLSKEEIEQVISNIGSNEDKFIRWVRNVYNRAVRTAVHVEEVQGGDNYLNLLPRVKHALRLRKDVAQKEADNALLLLATLRVEPNEDKIRPISNAELEMLLKETRKPKE
jgi:hypothetical protein